MGGGVVIRVKFWGEPRDCLVYYQQGSVSASYAVQLDAHLHRRL